MTILSGISETNVKDRNVINAKLIRSKCVSQAQNVYQNSLCQLNEVMTLPRPLVGWKGVYLFPVPLSVDAFGASIWEPCDHPLLLKINRGYGLAGASNHFSGQQLVFMAACLRRVNPVSVG